MVDHPPCGGTQSKPPPRSFELRSMKTFLLANLLAQMIPGDISAGVKTCSLLSCIVAGLSDVVSFERCDLLVCWLEELHSQELAILFPMLLQPHLLGNRVKSGRVNPHL